MPHKARMLWSKPSLRPFWGGGSRILGSGPPFCVQLLFFWHSGGPLYHNIEQHLSARAPTRAPAESWKPVASGAGVPLY